MDYVYHFTTRKKWKSIRETGLLEPKTEPRTEDLDLSVKQIITARKYLVGIPLEGANAWAEKNIFRELCTHSGNSLLLPVWATPTIEELKKQLVLLSVPVLNPEKTFVREHWFVSEQYTEVISPGLMSDLEEALLSRGLNDMSTEQWNLWHSLKHRYLNSAVRLTEYNSKFKMPEAWLAQRTPTSKIRRLQIGRVKYFADAYHSLR